MINQGDYFFCFENRCLITYCEAIRGGLGADVVRRAVKVKASLSELVVRLDRALAEAPLRLCLLEKSSSCRVLEHLADTLVGLGRALEVLVGVDPLPESLTLLLSALACVFQIKSGGKGTRHETGIISHVHVSASRTSSGETGFWLVLRSSSMVLGSWRKSFLQPTRIIGTSRQKWRTSECHCSNG